MARTTKATRSQVSALAPEQQQIIQEWSSKEHQLLKGKKDKNWSEKHTGQEGQEATTVSSMLSWLLCERLPRG